LSKGRIYVSDNDYVYTIVFGEDSSVPMAEKSFCSFMCNISAPNPVLEYVRTLNVMGVLPELEALEQVWTPNVMPALHEVSFRVRSWGSHLARLPAVRAWILRHCRNIERVEIADCARNYGPALPGSAPLAQFARQLQEEQVVLEVVWRD
jgi:hypothetical protein